MTMTVAAATLITTALDSSDAEAAHSPIMQFAARALAVLMPVLGGLAGYAIAIRVGDYGWTPNRVAAAVIAAVVLGYALFYAVRSCCVETGCSGSARRMWCRRW